MNVYPDLIERIKAVFIDMLVLIFLMFIFSTIFSSFESVPDEARIGAFVFIFLLYDPIFTSFLGGTIGHVVIGIRVKQSENKEKKTLSLGTLSLKTGGATSAPASGKKAVVEVKRKRQINIGGKVKAWQDINNVLKIESTNKGRIDKVLY